MIGRCAALAGIIGGSLLAMCGGASSSPYMIVGNDEKAIWDDEGKLVLSPPGKDSVLIVDLANPEDPKIIASLPLKNSVVGPPVNVAINPSGTLALVADSIDVLKDGANLKQVPITRCMSSILRQSSKAFDDYRRRKNAFRFGHQPERRHGLIANRGDNSVAVLSIRGKEVKLVDTVPMGDVVSHVAFTPDGRRAVAVKFPNHKISILEISDNGKVTYNKVDLPTGQWPYNVAVSPNGKIAITADNGNSGASDGSVDTVSVVDLEASPPRITDRVVVGDGPEGLAISPKGDVAVAVILRGSNSNKKSYFYNKNGNIDILKIDGKNLSKIKEIEVGGLPEAAVFTPDGRYLLVGNYLDQDFSILRVDGTEITDTGKRFKVPGHPASARMSLR